MSRQADLYALSVKLDLQTAAFNKGVASANKSLNSMDRRFKRSAAVFKQFAIGMASAFSIRVIANFAKATLDAADHIAKVSKTVGLSAEEFQKLSVVAELGGVNVSLFESSMTAFVKRIGEARAGIGPLVSSLKKMDTELLNALTSAKDQREAFSILSDAYKKADSAAEKAALMNAAFGRSGIAMGNMMIDGSKGVDHLSERIHVLSEENQKAAEKINDDWTVFFHNFTVGIQNMLINWTRTLNAMADKMSKWRFNTSIQKSREQLVYLKNELQGIRQQLERPIENRSGMLDDTKLRGMEQVVLGYMRQMHESISQTTKGLNEIGAIKLEEGSTLDLITNTNAGISGGGGAAKKLAADMKKITTATEDVNKELTKMQEIGENAIGDLSHGIADTLVDSFTSAEASFEDFIKSFLEGIAKAILQAQILAGLKMIPGVGSLFSGGASTFAAAAPGITRFNSAPSAPSLYSSGAIATNTAASRASGVSVNVNNYADATVETKSETDEAGNVSITLLVENAMKSAMGSGRMDKTMLGNYGARRVFG